VPLVERAAQPLERAPEARLHRRERQAQSLGDLARRMVLVVALPQHRAVRLVERTHGLEHGALQVEPLERIVWTRLGFRSRHGLLARGAPLARPARVQRQTPRHGREPGAQALLLRRSALERAQLGLLHDVLRRRVVAQEPAREPAQEVALGAELEVVERCVGRIHVRGRQREDTAEEPADSSALVTAMIHALCGAGDSRS
jgi:hypothetical protein